MKNNKFKALLGLVLLSNVMMHIVTNVWLGDVVRVTISWRVIFSLFIISNILLGTVIIYDLLRKR